MHIKKNFITLIVCCLVSCENLNVINTVVEGHNIEMRIGDEQNEKLAWDYPMKYGVPGWEALKTTEERFNAYNIPDAILNSISTEELVKICMAYPQWGLMHAFNDRRTGFCVLVDYFNGFQELFKRDDAAIELLKAYDRLDPLSVEPTWTPLQQGIYSARFEKIEMFLSTKTMIDKLDNEGLRRLKEVVISKYQKKRELPEIYSLFDLSPTVAICTNIIEQKTPNLLRTNREVINVFMFSFMSEDVQLLDSLLELLKTTDL